MSILDILVNASMNLNLRMQGAIRRKEGGGGRWRVEDNGRPKGHGAKSGRFADYPRYSYQLMIVYRERECAEDWRCGDMIIGSVWESREWAEVVG